MKTRVDDRLRLEVARFAFKFSCEDCAYFDPDAELCSEGYPTDEHRSASLDKQEVLFCKLFEGM